MIAEIDELNDKLRILAKSYWGLRQQVIQLEMIIESLELKIKKLKHETK